MLGVFYFIIFIGGALLFIYYVGGWTESKIQTRIDTKRNKMSDVENVLYCLMVIGREDYVKTVIRQPLEVEIAQKYGVTGNSFMECIGNAYTRYRTKYIVHGKRALKDDMLQELERERNQIINSISPGDDLEYFSKKLTLS